MLPPMENNPWKTLNTKQIYKNNWISVREDTVIHPDGTEGIYGVVETRIAVGIIAITDNDEIYLVGQWRYPLELYSWEIIEGGSEDEESALETAKRELKEEAGLSAASWEQLGGEVHLSNCFSSEKAIFFVARDLSQGLSSPDSTEVLQVKKVSVKDVFAMVDDGEITDAMSVIALHRLRQKFFS